MPLFWKFNLDIDSSFYIFFRRRYLLNIYCTLSASKKYILIFRYLSLFVFLGIFLYSCTVPFVRISSSICFRDEKQIQLWNHAQSFLGTPYCFGGSDKKCLDCSGLIVRLYQDIYDKQLPQSTQALITLGKGIFLRSLETGDLLFFRLIKEEKVLHVGLYLGKGVFIHASSSKGVILSNIREKYYKQGYIGSRRILGQT